MALVHLYVLYILPYFYTKSQSNGLEIMIKCTIQEWLSQSFNILNDTLPALMRKELGLLITLSLILREKGSIQCCWEGHSPTRQKHLDNRVEKIKMKLILSTDNI